MELVFIWVEDFRSLKNFSLNFHNDYNISYLNQKNQLHIEPQKTTIPKNFFGKNINNLKAIIGENGSGKTLTLELIYGFLDNYYVRSIAVFRQKINNKYRLRSYHHRSTPAPKIIFPEKEMKNIIIDGMKEHGRGNNDAISKMLSDHMNMVYMNYGMSANTFHSHSFCTDLSSHNLMLNVQNNVGKRNNPESVIRTYLLDEAMRFTNFLDARKNKKKYVFSQRINQIGIYFPINTNRERSIYQKFMVRLIDQPFFSKLLHEAVNKGYRMQDLSDWIIFRDSKIPKILLGMDLVLSHTQKFTLGEIDNPEQLLNLLSSYITKNLPTTCGQLFKYILSLDDSDLDAEMRGHRMEGQLTIFPDPTGQQFKLKVNKAAQFLKYYSQIIENNKTDAIKFKYGFHFGISSGELSFLSYFSRLHSISDKIKSKEYAILLIDEGELHLHPSWQKKFIKYFTEFLFSEFPKQKFQVIIATHSPFIFNDIPKESGIVLFRKKDRYLAQYNITNSDQTFGSNIHKLYVEQFLINDSLMGDFAKEKIVKIIKTVNQSKRIDETKAKKLLPEINLIGENFIRRKILEKMIEKADETVKVLLKVILKQINMIQIYIPNKLKLKSDYIKANKTWIKERVDFYINSFRFVNNEIDINALTASNKLHHKTQTALLRRLLKPDSYDKLTGRTDYHLVKTEIDQSYITKSNLYIRKLKSIGSDKVISSILLSEPDELPGIQKKIFDSWDSIQNLRPIIQRIFDYKVLRDESSYNLSHICSKISLKSCPYCNSVKISFSDGDNNPIFSPTIDHFFDIQNYPLLGTSLFNLIPACTNCNTLCKNQVQFNLKDYLNPYIEEFGNDARFKTIQVVKAGQISYKSCLQLNISKSSKKYRKIVGVTPSTQSKIGNANIFKLNQLYESEYSTEITSIHRTCKDKSPEYVDSIGIFLKKLDQSREDYYFDEFKTYLDSKKFQQKDLSKFQYDIVSEQLESFNIHLKSK